MVIWWHQGERDEAGDLLEDEGYRCEIDGEPVPAYLRWASVARPPDRRGHFSPAVAIAGLGGKTCPG